MTHAEDLVRGDAEIAALVKQLDNVCAVCRQADCTHFDAHYSGLVPFGGGDDQLHAESDKA